MPQVPIQVEHLDAGTTYQIVSNDVVTDEIEVVTQEGEILEEGTAILDGSEYETVRIISSEGGEGLDEPVPEQSYIVMINSDQVTYAYET